MGKSRQADRGVPTLGEVTVATWSTHSVGKSRSHVPSSRTPRSPWSHRGGSRLGRVSPGRVPPVPSLREGMCVPRVPSREVGGEGREPTVRCDGLRPGAARCAPGASLRLSRGEDVQYPLPRTLCVHLVGAVPGLHLCFTTLRENRKVSRITIIITLLCSAGGWVARATIIVVNEQNVVV